MITDERGLTRPLLVPLSEPAKDLLDAFRQAVRDWERGAEGLLLSFIGKMPGFALRLSLVLAYLDWAAGGDSEPLEIAAIDLGRAAHLLEAYLLPMARRAYADAALSKAERGARRLIAAIRAQNWTRFSSREALRLDLPGLSTAAKLNPALALLEEGDAIRAIDLAPGPQGGRPSRAFAVNPALHEATP